MKNLKHVFFALLLLFIALWVPRYVEDQDPLFITITLLLLGFFIFNLAIRKSLAYKSYFTSPYNFLTAKFRSELTYDIPKELMFEKVLEVINGSKFKLADVDKDRFEILATASMTAFSWGENLYISFDGSGDRPTLKVCSATFFQVHSWGRNEKNYEYLMQEIEASLTI